MCSVHHHKCNNLKQKNIVTLYPTCMSTSFLSLLFRAWVCLLIILVPKMLLRLSHKNNVRFDSSLPPVFVLFMSYLPYVCLFAYIGVQRILYCVFDLLASVLCNLCCQFIWIVHFWLPLRYYLTLIHMTIFPLRQNLQTHINISLTAFIISNLAVEAIYSMFVTTQLFSDVVLQ